MSNTLALLPKIKQEQLLSERSFIRYCNDDYVGHKKLNINSEFLRAVEADGFLSPLLKTKKTELKDGIESDVLENHYSPHQIFIVVALSKNQIHEGLLWHNQDLEFYIQQGFRMVNWGWSGFAFTISHKQQDKQMRIVEQIHAGGAGFVVAEKVGKSRHDPRVEYLKVCCDFQNFLMLLHSLNQYESWRSNYRKKERHFSEAPSLYFDLSPLEVEGEKTLGKYGLNLNRLKVLAREIARMGSDIDPLEHWYYYISLHPQWRKDFFKGDAAVAQELYEIYDLLNEVIETISGEKQQPLFELMYGEQKFYPYLIPRMEYVNGTDVKSMQAAIQKFKEWSKQEDNMEFVDESILKSLENFETCLKEYEDKYGARSFISNGIREVEVEEKIKLEDLDPKTRYFVDNMIQQAQEQLKENKRQFLSLRDDKLEEMIKKKEITLEDAKLEDYEYFLRSEIANAIEDRLRSLDRELGEIFHNVYQKIANKVESAWDTEHNFGNYFWFNRKEELNSLSREKQHELYQSEYDKVLAEAQYWSRKRDEFGRIEYIMNLLYCSACRNNPVTIHQSHNDEKISNNAICDDCIKNAQDPKKIKQAELKCDYCGAMLYKFAYQNRLNDLLFNQAPADIDVELEYGRLQVQIKCKNCKQVNRRFIDWGWTA